MLARQNILHLLARIQDLGDESTTRAGGAGLVSH